MCNGEVKTEIMLRRVLDRQSDRHRRLSDDAGAPSTPRRETTEIPRTRLLEKQARLERVPVYRPSPPPLKTLPPKLLNTLRWDGNQVDRFIPNRRTQNLEAARYNLMKKADQYELDSQPNNYLDVIAQIKTLESTWRKRLMTRAIQDIGIVSGVGDRRILNMSTKTDLKGLNYCTTGRSRDSAADDWEEVVWKVKPRKWPLIDEHKQKVRIESTRSQRKNIDWSSKECIVLPVGKHLHFFNLSDHDRSHISVSVESSFPGSKTIQCLKWNNAGTAVAMYSRSLTICIFNIEVSKVAWSEQCLCEHCDITCLAWTIDDKQLVVGCTNGKIALFCAGPSAVCRDDRLIEFVDAHDEAILNIAISPNNKYLATTSLNRMIKIYVMDGMVLYLEIGYYDAAQAFAWHPWDSGKLCIGGGSGDGSLSLWDMKKQESMGYKRVAFAGHVKNMVWNNKSGELVVQWYYWINHKRYVTIPVLASWDRVVDHLHWEKRYGSHVDNLIWNSDHTRIAVHLTHALLIFNFFGNRESSWSIDNKDEDKRNFSRKVTGPLSQFGIR